MCMIENGKFYPTQFHIIFIMNHIWAFSTSHFIHGDVRLYKGLTFLGLILKASPEKQCI